MRIFVYGTLRRGDAANELLEGCVHEGPAEIGGTLHDVDGRYPTLVLGGSGTVRGEVWSGPDDVLARLDAYEGVDRGLFRRAAVEIGGSECWTYVAGPLLEARLSTCPVIAEGEWRPRPR